MFGDWLEESPKAEQPVNRPLPAPHTGVYRRGDGEAKLLLKFRDNDVAIRKIGRFSLLRGRTIDGGEVHLRQHEVHGALLVDSFRLPPAQGCDHYPPAASVPCSMHLYVYEADGCTIAWEVSTDPEHPTPYLCQPDRIGEQQADFAAGRATVGQVNVAVIDPATEPGDQASGWLTARLADLYGRRCRLLRWVDETIGWVVVIDGPAGPPRLDPSFAAFTWDIRDTRETERKTRAFTQNTTATLLPVGVMDGYGQREDGTWLIPPTAPLLATYRWTPMSPFSPANGSLDLSEHWNGRPKEGGKLKNDRAAIREADAEAMQPGDAVSLGLFETTHYSHLEVLWRPAGSNAPWQSITPGRKDFLYAYNCVLSDGVTKAIGVYLLSLGGGAFGIGGHGIEDKARVEIIVRYKGTPTKDHPFRWEGTAGDLLQRLYDGEFSPPEVEYVMGFPVYRPVATGIRYDADALDLMTEPVMLAIEEPVDNLREWAEKKIFAPLGYTPVLNAEGRIAPIKQRWPQPGEKVYDLRDRDAEPVPGWSHGAKVINTLEFRYARDYPDPDIPGAIATQDVLVVIRNPESVRRYGEKKLELDGTAFRALGGANGEQLGDEYGQQLAEERKKMLFDQYKFGAPTVVVPALRRDLEGVQPGSWCRVSVNWAPDYTTGRRGLEEHWGRVTAVGQLDCAWLELTVELMPTPPDPEPEPDPDDDPVEFTEAGATWTEFGGGWALSLRLQATEAVRSVRVQYVYSSVKNGTEWDRRVDRVYDIEIASSMLLEDVDGAINVWDEDDTAKPLIVLVTPYSEPNGAGRMGTMRVLDTGFVPPEPDPGPVEFTEAEARWNGEQNSMWVELELVATPAVQSMRVLYTYSSVKDGPHDRSVNLVYDIGHITHMTLEDEFGNIKLWSDDDSSKPDTIVVVPYSGQGGSGQQGPSLQLSIKPRGTV